MILDDKPYTIERHGDLDEYNNGLTIYNDQGTAIGMISIFLDPTLAEVGLAAEVARLIEQTPALFTIARRFTRNLHATMAKAQPGAHPRADTLAGVVAAIEGDGQP